MTLPALTRTLLEKTAFDNGFDRDLPPVDDWLAHASTQCPLRLWLTAASTHGPFLAALSQPNVARALDPHGSPAPATVILPPGATAARTVPTLAALHDLVHRAFQLSRTLPDELLHTYQKRTASLPRSTEAERLVVQRVGQNLFREGLMDYWQSRCAITHLAVPELLRASHIKPWADCSADAERLDVFNGLLLAPHLDAAFDRGFITLRDDGTVLVSDALSPDDRRLLGLDAPLRARALADGHRHYLPYHRERVFKPRAG